MRVWLAVFLLTSAFAAPASAGETTVAVAANFMPAFRVIAAEFDRASGHHVRAVAGASGTFFSQIKNGARFDVFFSADRERPQRLEEEGNGVHGSRFTYAVGRLVLWSPDGEAVSGELTLRRGWFNHLAMANPRLAPYGMAAKQVMMTLGVWDQLQPRLVQGESLGQTMGFVMSGNAELGFVALSQILDPSVALAGSRWDVPPNLHRPIDQDVVLLVHGRSNPAALALMDYVRGPEARRVIERFGYDVK
jgi:molybdate transport system substrate-binding protein